MYFAKVFCYSAKTRDACRSKIHESFVEMNLTAEFYLNAGLLLVGYIGSDYHVVQMSRLISSINYTYF